MGRVTVHCRVTGTGPSSAVLFPIGRGQTSRKGAGCPATHTHLPALPPETEVAAQGPPSHLLGVQGRWAAPQHKGLPPRKASSSPFHASSITTDNIYRQIDPSPPDTLLHNPVLHFPRIPGPPVALFPSHVRKRRARAYRCRYRAATGDMASSRPRSW